MPTHKPIPKKTLRRLYIVEKRTMRDIADIRGCSHTQVQRELHRHGIPTRKNGTAGTPKTLGMRWTKIKESPEEIRRLYWDFGMSLPEVAEAIGVERGAVNNFMRKHGIPKRSVMESTQARAKMTRKKVIAMRLAYSKGATQAELARKYGLHVHTAYNIVNGVTWKNVAYLPRRRTGK